MQVKAFEPAYKKGQSITVTTTAAAITMADDQLDAVTLTVVGTAIVWVLVTAASSTTNAETVFDYPVLPNSQVVITMPKEWRRLSAISTATGSVLYVNPGRGM